MADFNEYKGVWVFCEQRQGKLMPTDFELVSEARKLADELNCEVTGLLLGDNVDGIAKELGGYGADKVMVCDSPLLKDYTTDAYAKVVCDMVNEYKPEVLLIGATNIGRDLGPRCAARLHTGLTADCTKLEMKSNTDLVQIRPAFGGNIMAQIVISESRPQFATVRYKVMDRAEKVEKPSGKITVCPVSEDMVRSRIEVLSAKVLEHVRSIEEEDVLVVAGRGAGKALDQLKELAELLGGQLCFTRPMIEDGYGDTAHQIGLSGRTVKPKLILTFGVSGAIQFTACMNSAECIVAVNNDPEAPIFNIADIAIRDDLYAVLPELLNDVKNRKDGE